MIPKGLGIILIIAVVIVALLYSKMILTWRDAMIERNERYRKDMKRLHYLQKRKKNY